MEKHKSILVTGVAGSGKSAVCGELSGMGYKAFDIERVDGLFAMTKKSTSEKVVGRFDHHNLDNWVDHAWTCDIDKMEKLINENGSGLVFYCGTGTNIDDVIPLFDKTILLVASEDVTKHRLTHRTSNDFGRSPEVQNWIFSWKENLENHIKSLGAVVVNADQDLHSVADEIVGKSAE